MGHLTGEKTYSDVEVEDLLQKCLCNVGIYQQDFHKVSESSDVLNSYHDLIINRPPSYRDKLRQYEKQVENSCGISGRLSFHKALVYHLYLKNRPKIDHQDLPLRVLNYLQQDFHRILKLATNGKDSFLTFNNYQFLSYLELLCFKRFPLGNQNVVITGFSRSLIFRQSFLKSISFMRLIWRIGGNYPLFELHYNPHRFRLFNPEGWNEVFCLAAQMMLKYPEIKGVFGGAWFYDPAIKEISPELYYVRQLIEEIGGHFFLMGSGEEDKKNAFALSKARKIAYEEGRYLPSSYIAIIPRSVLLRFYGS